jgi:hypothetical protein
MSLYSYTNTGYGNAEYLLGLMGFIVYNLTWAKNAPLASEVTYLFHLCTNIGVISTAALFNHSISLYLFSIDGQWPLIVIGVLGIIGNSTSALFFELEFDYRNTYCTYRVALGVLLVRNSNVIMSFSSCTNAYVYLRSPFFRLLFLAIPSGLSGPELLVF